MEENLQSRTFNKTSKPFNNFVNEIRNPYTNNISTDLSYKRRAIHETRRNPEHIGNGPDYLFAKRVGIIRRNYQFGKITRAQYENEYRKIYIARWGCPPPMKLTQRYQVQLSAHDAKEISDVDGDGEREHEHDGDGGGEHEHDGEGDEHEREHDGDGEREGERDDEHEQENEHDKEPIPKTSNIKDIISLTYDA